MGILSSIIATVSSAIATAASFLGGLGTVAKLAIGIGLQLLSSWLNKSSQSKGTVFDREYGETVPRRVAVGLCAASGHDIYVNTWGKSNKWLHQIYQLSDFPCDALIRIGIGGEWVEFGESDDPLKGLTPVSGDLRNLVWVRFIDGWQTEADQDLIDNANPSGRWTADHVGHGCAGVKVTLRYDKDDNNSFPDFFFEFRGAPLYDWRKDSSVGGAGAHRWNDKSTWEFTENPRVIEYNYRRGLDWNGDVFCGMEMPATDLPLGAWTAAANICDETADDGETRYRLSMFLDCAATHGDNIEGMQAASAGMTVDGVDGVWPITGASQPIVATFTDGDLVVGEAVKVRLRESMARRVNSVGGSYPDPDNLWSATSYETQVVAAAVARDRRTRDVTMNFDTVRHRFQAESLARIYVTENQYQATATVTLMPRLRAIRAGDWVRWNSARYGDRTWLVQASSLRRLGVDRPRVLTLTLMERDASIYDAPAGTPAPTIILPAEPDYATETDNLAVIGIVATAPNGKAYPGLRVSWSPFDDETVTHVEIEYRVAGTAEPVFSRRNAADITVAALTEGVVSSTLFEARTRIVTEPRRAVSWSAWAQATTPDVATNDISVELETLADDSRAVIAEMRADLEQLRTDMESLANATADATASAIVRHGASIATARGQASAISSLYATVEEIPTVYHQPGPPPTTAPENSIWFDSDDENKTYVLVAGEWVDASAAGMTVFSQDDEPTTTVVGALWFDTDDGNRQYRWSGTAWEEVSDTRVTAIAAALTEVTAKTDDGTAEGLVGWVATSAPSGVTARYAVQGRATSGDAFAQGGFYLDVTPTQVRVTFDVDKFIVMNGSSPVAPFAIESGVVKMQNVILGTLTFDQLQSANGKLVLKGSGTNASVELFS